MEIIKVPKFKRKFGKELVNNENAIDNRKKTKMEINLKMLMIIH